MCDPLGDRPLNSWFGSCLALGGA